ncbi:VOC family protein [Actinomadura oligospora]|uniref:VOC family protein n=1 Tax=Actinomadura oligospora TaxID=111804 RepID=UPI00047BA307|nr:VOC family protein [Actinomadura oligospora]
MSLHRLTEITLGVPNVKETAEYYTDFGLEPLRSDDPSEHWFGTVDGGRQLRVVRAPIRRLLSLGIGVDDPDDLARIAASLERLEIPNRPHGDRITTREPVTGTDVTIEIAPRIVQRPTPTPPANTPGSITRPNARAIPLLREDPVRPRRLGHVALGSTDLRATQRFFQDGVGFKLSDEIRDTATFMRCSPDHHNVALQPAPVDFLHHTSWEVDDVDEIGRGAQAVLEDHPERHTWGLGRHWVGSNFFYYFRDPAGNMSEYYSDMDEITDDELWNPTVWEPAYGNSWGPPVPPSMIEPDDLAQLMAGMH